MIEIHYLDAYKQERIQTFENKDAAILAFSGCLTLPDYYPVTSITQDGQALDYGSLSTVVGRRKANT